MKKVEITTQAMDSIIDFIHQSIYASVHENGEMYDVIVSMPRYIIETLKSGLPIHNGYGYMDFGCGLIDVRTNTIFGKKVQISYNNSVVVFADSYLPGECKQYTLDLCNYDI